MLIRTILALFEVEFSTGELVLTVATARRCDSTGGEPYTDGMNALLLVAHGSRRTESNTEIAALADRLRERLGQNANAPVVEHAFLELAEPSIPDGIERCLERGATSVDVVPYFLARGTHVADDIPAEVDAKRKERPDVEIRITDYLGTSDALVDVLIGLAKKG